MKLTNEQIRFAKAMSARQRAVLRGLAGASFHLSVTEWADRELYALVSHGLARCFDPAPGLASLWGWTATDQGRAALRLLDRRKAKAQAQRDQQPLRR